MPDLNVVKGHGKPFKINRHEPDGFTRAFLQQSVLFVFYSVFHCRADRLSAPLI